MIALSSASVLALAALAGGPVRAVLAPAAADTACIVMVMDLESRSSPLDSLSFEVEGQTVKICYGRPSARGRTMIGGRNVPYGKLWRTGANEPTMIHTTTALSVAGIDVEPGSYSLYTIPTEDEWEIIVNRSITQSGHEGRYSEEVKAQEVGRGTVPSERMEDHVESFAIRSEPAESGVTVILEWEHTRVRIPVRGKR